MSTKRSFAYGTHDVASHLGSGNFAGGKLLHGPLKAIFRRPQTAPEVADLATALRRETIECIIVVQ